LISFNVVRIKSESNFTSDRMRFSAVVLCLLFVAGHLLADKSYCFRLYLKDKGENSFKLAFPEEFLSEEAVERRMMWEIFVDETDFPVSQTYIDELIALGVTPVVQSKWLKTVVVESADSAVVEALKLIPFVDSLTCVWNNENRLDPFPYEDDTTYYTSSDEPLENPYGYAENQIEMLNGVNLHQAGYRGKGVRIAVIDAGFMNVNRIEAFASMHLIGTKNITFPDEDVFNDDTHGTKVLSCLAANLPGFMIGTAPEASYLLIKSEDSRRETPIEEDYWVAAIEYADSVGVDVISSSLGYNRYDSIDDYYTRDNLDGRTAFISRAADIAVKKGLLVVSSAGNEGVNDWEKITFPSDVEGVLTVGSVNAEKERSFFSSTGLTADYRIKPDVVALGSRVCVIGSGGQTQETDGTSFSTPIIAGMAACLWQAFPLLKNEDIIQLIKDASTQSRQPDTQVGYGIPDMFKAYKQADDNAIRNN